MLTTALEMSFTGSFLLQRFRQLKEVATSSSFSAATTSSSSTASRTWRTLALILLDLLLGLAVANAVAEKWPPARIVQTVLEAMDLVVFYLRQLVTWLMGAPAGLKLNSVLSEALGKFFLYHIHLWVTFLYLTAPFVTQGLERAMTVLSFTGFCLQVSVAQDTFNLTTFHVHCFFAYARRLFVSQTSGLQSLWRLFRGKKYNPLRNRVDSSVLDVDQLFVGTLAFAILLFLYPTTLTYFCVFKVLELVIVAVNVALSAIVRMVSTFQLS